MMGKEMPVHAIRVMHRSLVINVLGKAKGYNSFVVIVKEFAIDQPRQTIDVSDLMSGIYYIEFDQGENNRTT